MNRYCLLAICFALLAMILRTEGYTFRGKVDTSSGFCMMEKRGKIPVGESVYDDESCERITCGEGMYHVVGCGTVAIDGGSTCRLERGTGHYPNCCQQPKCD